MGKVSIKSIAEIELMRESCRIVAEVLKMLKAVIRPGVTTQELDEFAEDFIRSQGGEPAFKGYGYDKNNLFPASLCTSIEDEVVHGIPGSRKLKEGQIISVDVGVKKDGFFGDGAYTYQVGVVSDDKKKLLRVTEESLLKGIEKAQNNGYVHDVSAAIQEHVEKAGFSVVRDLVGHGIGRKLHEEPAVPNFGVKGTGVVLKPGMTLAIEPMINMGEYRVRVESDGWTVMTADGLPSAHFEHTVLITEEKAEILTI